MAIPFHLPALRPNEHYEVTGDGCTPVKFGISKSALDYDFYGYDWRSNYARDGKHVDHHTTVGSGGFHVYSDVNELRNQYTTIGSRVMNIKKVLMSDFAWVAIIIKEPTECMPRVVFLPGETYYSPSDKESIEQFMFEAFHLQKGQYTVTSWHDSETQKGEWVVVKSVRVKWGDFE